ncbi:MAG TPA: sigma-54 factor interaction domain-containing protein, partial [Anaerolineales bacterium]|nr:sigma-54 factor interaction domain-containing protein [Anaerolineales bacterium]
MHLRASDRDPESREHKPNSASKDTITRRDGRPGALQTHLEDTHSQSVRFFSGQISQYTQTLLAEIERVAQRPFNILITGETGTGKTYAAREIHRLSARSTQPFLELNCANLPEQLVEAELFGFSKGAFTGADHNHKGLFEEADGGMLFLDEIGDISSAVQSKLLRAIDEKQIKRLGTNHYRYCDVQIIAATSRNLSEMIEAGQFREDLYCRLAVLTIETAPLRNHREDIPALIAFYLREATEAIS